MPSHRHKITEENRWRHEENMANLEQALGLSLDRHELDDHHVRTAHTTTISCITPAYASTLPAGLWLLRCCGWGCDRAE